ncbi:MAG TPA: peptidase T [Candidatus Eisenbacteria bacterium]|nr:peptidase T [Candidatus Eisenbacteria bacterium]
MPATAPNTQKTSALERFLRYVAVDTQSDPNSRTYPSTAKQLVLLDQLAAELKALGLADVTRDEHGYVFATIPATTKKSNVPVVGFVAHVDTSPETSGTNVRPIVHRDYAGGDIVLPDDPAAVIRVAEDPELAAKKGEDIVTASGATLLGADDKAGVAEIMAAAEYLVQHPDIPHGAIRIGFTPDEEVGGGTTYFDIARFGAACAYTLDGTSLGSLDAETFSADAMTVTFQGFNTHPGYARAKMINAIKIAAEFIARLPRDRISPETTDGREGFVHPNDVVASVDRTSVKFIVRDFATAGLAVKEALIETLARETVAQWPGSSVSFEVKNSYRNMKDVLDRHPAIVENAREAIRRAGVKPIESAVRGGTDGSRLTEMGLPTPNIFAGGHNFHSRLEWVSAQDMEKAVEVVVQLARVWEERS